MKVVQEFIKYFESKSHTIVKSSSLLPDGDNSVLLTTAGMQQFKPYYLGKPSPYGNRVASIQKCIRVDDIEEVGDNTHLTFFEMLGNFSFNYNSGKGSYFKAEAIRFGYEFIAEYLNLQIDYVTIFAGDDISPKDTESQQIWQDLFKEKNVKIDIREYGRADNFWGPTGSEGPCGPTTEIYVNDVEIWNIVFNQYYSNLDKSLVNLENQGIDTGGGLERILTYYEGVDSMYDTTYFRPILDQAKDFLPDLPLEKQRMILDHIRASLFLIADGVLPSNKEQGYILRRLLRKVLSLFSDKEKGLEEISIIAAEIRDLYKDRYSELELSHNIYKNIMEEEYILFRDALNQGMRYANKILKKKRVQRMSGEEAFLLSATYGLSAEVMKLQGLDFDAKELDLKKKKHQEISRAGANKKFGGHGLLLDNGELKASNEEELKIVTRLHSVTHLLQKALREVLGDDVIQKGSDITAERTRFDFTFDRKMTDEEKKQVEDLVNSYIDLGLDVKIDTMSLEEAKKTDALYLLNRNYPDKVSVYKFGDISKEFCGGPHVNNTKEIGKFHIKKEEAVASGVRRIRGVIE